ncbi:MAG: putative ATP-dependent helicase DinG [Alphaproteobacteria bacterium ADurb.BinA280]|nr:MAG: putative ATP-dependent helicase DinG [Alphaproteobacteria bacterium ADurb.BinA280]
MAELVRDTIAECGSVTGVLGILQPLTEAITTAVRKLRLAMDGFPGRAALKRIERDAEVEAGIEGLRLALEALVNGLAPHNERSRGLDSVHERAQSALARLNQLMDGSARDSVHWYELSAQGFSLHSTPLDLAQPLRELREQSHAAWIFTSATLSIAGDFTHFARQLGLDDPHTVCLQSPFDYQRQALAYLPAGLPEPNTDTHTERVVEAVIPVLAASQGRAFLLFTSHRALRRAADLLADRVPWPLFVQGSAPRHQLLEEFRASGNGVLLGAASFWEGVDVAGDALSVVVIDKLPFAAPDDPVLAARLETLREAGLKPFFDWQIPNAVIALKQGAGRLIRDIHDRGVLVLCDPRLTSKGYGRIFLASLPDMPRTTDIGAVQAFFGA